MRMLKEVSVYLVPVYLSTPLILLCSHVRWQAHPEREQRRSSTFLPCLFFSFTVQAFYILPS